MSRVLIVAVGSRGDVAPLTRTGAQITAPGSPRWPPPWIAARSSDSCCRTGILSIDTSRYCSRSRLGSAPSTRNGLPFVGISDPANANGRPAANAIRCESIN